MSNNDICNVSGDYIREIRWLGIYLASKLTFNEYLNGKYPRPEDYLLKISLNSANSYNRKVSIKKTNGNRYYYIDIKFHVYNLDTAVIRRLSELDGLDLLVVTASNKSQFVFGNRREPLRVDIVDNIKEDGKGRDSLIVRLRGRTIVAPRPSSIAPLFRVLFMTPRLG